MKAKLMLLPLLLFACEPMDVGGSETGANLYPTKDGRCIVRYSSFREGSLALWDMDCDTAREELRKVLNGKENGRDAGSKGNCN